MGQPGVLFRVPTAIKFLDQHGYQTAINIVFYLHWLSRNELAKSLKAGDKFNHFLVCFSYVLWRHLVIDARLADAKMTKRPLTRSI